MKQTRGFTIVELMSALVLVIALVTLGVAGKNNLDASSRDTHRKTAVNAFYYGLKEGYFKTNHAYPPSIDTATLPFIDPEFFKDPTGRSVGQPHSDYRYLGTDCIDGVCQGFEVQADLEKEADYKKSSND